jgi:hypothetical protein
MTCECKRRLLNKYGPRKPPAAAIWSEERASERFILAESQNESRALIVDRGSLIGSGLLCRASRVNSENGAFFGAFVLTLVNNTNGIHLACGPLVFLLCPPLFFGSAPNFTVLMGCEI